MENVLNIAHGIHVGNSLKAGDAHGELE
ncbi:hypothetical protein I304_03159 [Cryptococcus deuterogattii CBS 10090]|nr:hypothetical protein I304_03159 [Cryptococcus deuterogattii CBS 10090]